MSTVSSKNYSWSDVSVAMGGRILDGITEFEYTAKQDKGIRKGRGNKGHGITRGEKTYEGKLVLWQSEVEAMIESTPSKDILDLNFSIIFSYVPTDGGPTVTDIVPECEFTEMKKGFKQGDKEMLIELPIIFFDIKLQQ